MFLYVNCYKDYLQKRGNCEHVFLSCVFNLFTWFEFHMNFLPDFLYTWQRRKLSFITSTVGTKKWLKYFLPIWLLILQKELYHFLPQILLHPSEEAQWLVSCNNATWWLFFSLQYEHIRLWFTKRKLLKLTTLPRTDHIWSPSVLKIRDKRKMDNVPFKRYFLAYIQRNYVSVTHIPCSHCEKLNCLCCITCTRKL